MKRDWTRRQIRLSPHHLDGGFFSFLMFLRLMLVALFCLLGVPVFVHAYGPGIGLIACLAAFPLWWYHFGLRGEDGWDLTLLSTGFCLYGYFFITACLLVTVLEYFDILKEGRPNPGLAAVYPYVRPALWAGCAAFCVYWFATRKRR